MLIAACSSAAPAGEALEFDRDVRPILKLHCSHCHGESAELAGGLDVRLRRRLVEGGDSGAAVVAHQPEQSLLWQRILDGEMPPGEVDKRPTTEEIETLRRWIEQGALVSAEEPENLPPGPWISPAERLHWSFQEIADPSPPSVERAEQARQPLDLFLLAKLEPQDRGFAPPAHRETWLRRVSFDLTGLPPTPQQTELFLADRRPGAFRRQVDRLLASPAFGERWGRFWLDVAGYADSEGRVADPVRPHAWRYRDYVVGALNHGLPYDQFVIEQLAGDELVRPPYYSLEGRDLQRLTATGFLRMAADGSASGVNTDEDRNQVVADTVQIVGSSLLGLTVQCAQCHNHRYDPIPQADYYRLRAVLEPALNWRAWKTPAARRVSLYSPEDREQAKQVEEQAAALDKRRGQREQEHIDRVFNQELEKLPEEIRDSIRIARNRPEKDRTPEQKKLLAAHPSVNVTAGSLYLYDKKAADELKAMGEEARKLRAGKPVETFLRALTEPAGATPPESFVMLRGDHQQPGEQVTPGGLQVTGGADQVPSDDDSLPTTGRRLNYARWLVGGEHPLTARVAVNRIWQHLFGRGLVETPGDFGLLGARPSHPELLDYLAQQLQREQWEIKPLIRQIVLSSAYRQTSRQAADSRDPQNRLLGSMPLRRLDAEAVRDGMLAAAGSLNLQRGGPPVPVMADRVGQFVVGKENLNAGRPGAVIPMNGQEYRRSLYIEVRRSRPLAVLDAFDLPQMAPNCHCRPSSTGAPQSLLMMNSDLALRISRRFAESLIAEVGDDPRDQARAAWKRAYGESPDEEQLDEAAAYLAEQQQQFSDRDGKGLSPPAEALATFCQALLGSNRFLYLE